MIFLIKLRIRLGRKPWVQLLHEILKNSGGFSTTTTPNSICTMEHVTQDHKHLSRGFSSWDGPYDVQVQRLQSIHVSLQKIHFISCGIWTRWWWLHWTPLLRTITSTTLILPHGELMGQPNWAIWCRLSIVALNRHLLWFDLEISPCSLAFTTHAVDVPHAGIWCGLKWWGREKQWCYYSIRIL